ncbi:MAG: hypothetical protein MI976_08300 [Pseudomonadales bacterium]|nr:hypothetical protein [Pseudomonadales bacterium]
MAVVKRKKKTIDHTALAISAATVAAELHHAELIAKRLTISAKNAAAIVLRAGSRAAGLSVIANFYDELANKTISLARSINTTAVQLSAVTVTEWRTSVARQQINKAYQEAENTHHQASLEPFMESVNTKFAKLEGDFQVLLKQLNEKLDEVQQHMRAIDVIAVTSRLEAQRTGEFKEGLMQMAENIQSQANEIKSLVANSITLLKF